MGRFLVMPLGMLWITFIVVVGLVLLYGITTFYYFARFMKTNILGIPLWVIVLLIFAIMMFNRPKNKYKERSRRIRVKKW